MTANTAAVQKLRNETGLGVMDIKTALDEAGGDEAQALEILKKKAGDKMTKRADRATGQGKIGAYVHGDSKSAVLVEVGCETDFVAKNDDFQTFVKDITLQIISMNPIDVEELLAQDFVKDTSKKIADLLKELVAKTGENVAIKRFVVYRLGE